MIKQTGISPSSFILDWTILTNRASDCPKFSIPVQPAYTHHSKISLAHHQARNFKKKSKQAYIYKIALQEHSEPHSSPYCSPHSKHKLFTSKLL
ncbi:hypothetical protein K450DRAFT_216742 [Umbelopsis ramanniana AG]|uniref:Uncharacterized protein n=1 Tax=Umbelopsis ramanniana AG TaxID=1314678 RepID=A0AAD5HIY1_UMBRA|nr:uncharacterized protein K450DRAFT_216742 [Umbelopsis ramanniana AG]KAI8584519.1 hypothetical protein K450DRAFT_216742 [Umbelopsis ramanniana AG]